MFHVLRLLSLAAIIATKNEISLTIMEAIECEKVIRTVAPGNNVVRAGDDQDNTARKPDTHKRNQNFSVVFLSFADRGECLKQIVPFN